MLSFWEKGTTWLIFTKIDKINDFYFSIWDIMNIVKQYKSEKLFLNILDSLINYFYR